MNKLGLGLKSKIKKIPFLGKLIPEKRIIFKSSTDYWEQRYKAKQTSGPGSYNKLALFKAEIINNFIFSNKIEHIIELGCGDGNQLKLARYPHYIGFDVSNTALNLCRKIFNKDKTKEFYSMNELYKFTLRADISISLDVIYHLVEDDIYEKYILNLFKLSRKFVCIYSSDKEEEYVGGHVRHRNFTKYIKSNIVDWQLIEKIPNRYPYNGDILSSSFSDFFFYSKKI